MSSVISRSQAVDSGLNVYFTGKPCKRGHIAHRYASGSQCVECLQARNQASYQQNSALFVERARVWTENNRGRSLAIKQKWRTSNPDKQRAAEVKWRSDNPDYDAARWRASEEYREINRQSKRKHRRTYPERQQQYIESVKRRTPAWANHEAIRAVYLERDRLIAETGRKHHVDHVIPLHGETVSGLHVETNLQVLTFEENRKKWNTWPYHAEQIEASDL